MWRLWQTAMEGHWPDGSDTRYGPSFLPPAHSAHCSRWLLDAPHFEAAAHANCRQVSELLSPEACVFCSMLQNATEDDRWRGRASGIVSPRDAMFADRLSRCNKFPALQPFSREWLSLQMALGT